jgi:hypothetical protein
MKRKDAGEPVKKKRRRVNSRSIGDDHDVAAQDEKYIDSKLIPARKIYQHTLSRRLEGTNYGPN